MNILHYRTNKWVFQACGNSCSGIRWFAMSLGRFTLSCQYIKVRTGRDNRRFHRPDRISALHSPLEASKEVEDIWNQLFHDPHGLVSVSLITSLFFQSRCFSAGCEYTYMLDHTLTLFHFNFEELLWHLTDTHTDEVNSSTLSLLSKFSASFFIIMTDHS